MQQRIFIPTPQSPLFYVVDKMCDWYYNRIMVQVKVSEIAHKIEEVIYQVEKGENCLILREGKPIAEILPIKTRNQGWKRDIKKVKLPHGVSAQSYIETERNLS